MTCRYYYTFYVTIEKNKKNYIIIGEHGSSK